MKVRLGRRHAGRHRYADRMAPASGRESPTTTPNPDKEFAPNTWDLLPDTTDVGCAPPTGPLLLALPPAAGQPAAPPPEPGRLQPDGRRRLDPLPLQRLEGPRHDRRHVRRRRQRSCAGRPADTSRSTRSSGPSRTAAASSCPTRDDLSPPLFLYGTSEQARPSEQRRRVPGRIDSTGLAGPTPARRATRRSTTTVKMYRDRSPATTTSARSPTAAERGLGLPRLQRPRLHQRRRADAGARLPAGPVHQAVRRAAARAARTCPTAIGHTRGDNTPTISSGRFSPIPTTNDDWVPRSFEPARGQIRPTASTPTAYPATHQVRTYPYLVDEFYYSSPPDMAIQPRTTRRRRVPTRGLDGDGNGIPDGHMVGGPTGAGWHRMLEFFEVPAPVIDAIGPVAQGVNFDWFRQDRRPGQINPNLIVDEEVFFGLRRRPPAAEPVNARSRASSASAEVAAGRHPGRRQRHPDRPRTPMATAASRSSPTAHDLDGDGRSACSIAPTDLATPRDTGMKVPFADFLKQRHGGSGFLFGYGDGADRHALRRRHAAADANARRRSPPTGRTGRSPTTTSSGPCCGRRRWSRRPTRSRRQRAMPTHGATSATRASRVAARLRRHVDPPASDRPASSTCPTRPCRAASTPTPEEPGLRLQRQADRAADPAAAALPGARLRHCRRPAHRTPRTSHGEQPAERPRRSRADRQRRTTSATAADRREPGDVRPWRRPGRLPGRSPDPSGTGSVLPGGRPTPFARRSRTRSSTCGGTRTTAPSCSRR